MKPIIKYSNRKFYQQRKKIPRKSVALIETSISAVPFLHWFVQFFSCKLSITTDLSEILHKKIEKKKCLIFSWEIDFNVNNSNLKNQNDI